MATDPRHRHWPSLSTAFMTWLKAQPSDIRDEVVATKRQGRVCLRFPRFTALKGRVWNHCLAVYADEISDACRLFDLDCLPILWESEETFVCGFCEEEARGFDSREALFEDHLFEPFGAWITHKLKHAQGIDRKRIGRWRFVGLRMPATWDDAEDGGIDDGGVEHLRLYRRRWS